VAELANDRQQAERMAQLEREMEEYPTRLKYQLKQVSKISLLCSTLTSRTSRKEQSVGPAQMRCGKSSSFQHSGSGHEKTSTRQTWKGRGEISNRDREMGQGSRAFERRKRCPPKAGRRLRSKGTRQNRPGHGERQQTRQKDD